MTRTGGREQGLLHLFTPWPRGEQIVAGLAVFPPAPPIPRKLLGDVCGEDGCTSLAQALRTVANAVAPIVDGEMINARRELDLMHGPDA